MTGFCSSVFSRRLLISRAASAFMAAIPRPTIRSGHADRWYGRPAATIATLASASFRREEGSLRQATAMALKRVSMAAQ